jgi:hypothetical protein
MEGQNRFRVIKGGSSKTGGKEERRNEIRGQEPLEEIAWEKREEEILKALSDFFRDLQRLDLNYYKFIMRKAENFCNSVDENNFNSFLKALKALKKQSQDNNHMLRFLEFSFSVCQSLSEHGLNVSSKTLMRMFRHTKALDYEDFSKVNVMFSVCFGLILSKERVKDKINALQGDEKEKYIEQLINTLYNIVSSATKMQSLTDSKSIEGLYLFIDSF